MTEVSRRKFLKLSGAAAVGATFPSFLESTFTARAYATSIKEGMSEAEGAAALRYDALHTPNEVHAWYTEGAQGKWRRARDIGAVGNTDRDADEDRLFLTEHILPERPRRVRRAHTHPIGALALGGFILANYSEKRARNEVQAVVAPPSAADLITHIFFAKKYFAPDKISFQDDVFDPSGMWRMTVKDGPFSRALFAYQLLIHDAIPKALKRTALTEHQQISLLKSIKAMDVSAVDVFKVPEIKELADDCVSRDAAIGKDFLPTIDAYTSRVNTLQRRSTSLDAEDKATHIKRIIDTAARLDIILSFDPYTGSDPKKL